MGNNYVRYKAEVDFDGRELTRSYLDSQDLDALIKVCFNQYQLYHSSTISTTHLTFLKSIIIQLSFFTTFFFCVL